MCGLSLLGMRGNEDANTAAKAGLGERVTNMRVPASDLFTCVNQLYATEWQTSWNQYPSNKLVVKPKHRH